MNYPSIKIITSCLLPIMLAACGTTQKQTKTLVPQATADCSVPNFPLSYTLTNAPKAIAGKVLPKKFTTYLISNKELKQFFEQIKNGNNDQFAIPLPDACVIFALKNSETMDPALAAKFPEIVSKVGSSTNPLAKDARIDFDGKKLRVQVRYDNKTYFLEPYTEVGNQQVYVLYEKNDTGYPKSTFE